MQPLLVDSRYSVSGPLGGGGMARVYLAHDEKLNRDVALKILREQYAEDEQFVERFRREARSAAVLSHPNIVQVYDWGRTEEGVYYITMEYVSGGTLKDCILREGPLEPGSAVTAATEIAEALGAAHERGVVHRDVKPQNVLLSASGGVKVADFGIARAASATALSVSGLILGTAGYISPEQAIGKPATPRSDLYSLGVVLYEMLTGKMPFEAETPVAVCMKHVNEQPLSPKEENPDVPEGLDAIVTKLLAKDPEDRYANAAELTEDLRRVRRGETLVIRGTTSPRSDTASQAPTVVVKPGGGSKKRRRRFIPRVAVASVVLLALLSATAWGVSQSSEGWNVPGDQSGLFEMVGWAVAPNRVEVPSVVGLDQAEAQERLAGSGFESGVSFSESSEEDAGKVLNQSVAAGERAEEGAAITLEVGDGPYLLPAPDLAGMDLTEAEDALAEAGLVLGEQEEAPSETVSEGAVIEQDPAAGTEVEPETSVNLTLSSGLEEAAASEGQEKAAAPVAQEKAVAPVAQGEAPIPPADLDMELVSTRPPADVEPGIAKTQALPKQTPKPAAEASKTPEAKTPASTSAPPDAPQPVVVESRRVSEVSTSNRISSSEKASNDRGGGRAKGGGKASD